jgi:glycosyltransferase involved in cell wall biosynthesis
MPIRVRFDAQAFAAERRGGITNYFAHLIREFVLDPGLGVQVVGLPILTANTHALDLGVGRRPRLVPARSRSLRAVNALRQAPVRADVVHSTFYFREHLTRTAKRVVTVHDMIPERFPEMFPLGDPHLHKQGHVRQADAVVCVSAATRDDLLHFVPDVAAPVFITPLGVDAVDPQQPSRSGHGQQQPTVLFVGKRGYYKDFDVLVAALREIPEARLVLVGGGLLTEQERVLVANARLAGRIVHVTPDDAGLREQYRSATALVFPSRYEGFGLPALEAMSAGCPAVLADTPALREVAGATAEYFPPGDAPALAGVLQRLLDDPARRAAMSVAGRDRAAAFTWRRTAELTAEAYRVAAG